MKKSQLRKIIREEVEYMQGTDNATINKDNPIKKELMDAVNNIDSTIGKALNSGEMDKDVFHLLYKINTELFEALEKL
jgi:hypothetical protein